MRRSLLVTAIATVVVATGCPVDPGPGPQPLAWTATRVPLELTTPPVTHISSWTSDDWFVTSSGSLPFTASEMRFRARSGPAGATLGAPQIVPTSLQNASAVFGGHDLVGLRGMLNGNTAVEFFRETGGTWAAAGTAEFPDQVAIAQTDDWLFTRKTFEFFPPTGDGAVYAYALDASGPTVTATLAQTLLPDPSWIEEQRSSFGTVAAADGDLLTVTTVQQFANAGGLAPGVANVYRQSGGTWTPVATLGGATGDPITFGSAAAVDDGAATDRVVISHRSAATVDASVVPKVEVFADTGPGFALEQVLSPNPASPPDTNGSGGAFGNSVAIDGDHLALTSRWTTIAPSQPDNPDSTGGYVQIFTRGSSGWARDTEVAAFTDPMPAPFTAQTPTGLQMSGTHIAAMILVGFPIPPSCTFPQICLNFAVEGMSIDKTG